MEELYAAKYNVYWYLSYIVPWLIMFLAAFGGKKKIFIAGILISLIATFFLRVSAVVEKWKIRGEIADTQEEIAYAGADGTNLVVETAFIAPFQAIVSTIFWSIVSWLTLSSIKKRRINYAPP